MIRTRRGHLLNTEEQQETADDNQSISEEPLLIDDVSEEDKRDYKAYEWGAFLGGIGGTLYTFYIGWQLSREHPDDPSWGGALWALWIIATGFGCIGGALLAGIYNFLRGKIHITRR